KIWQEIRDIRIELKNLRSTYGGLSRSVGLLLERDARHYLPEWIKRNLGLNVDKLSRFAIRNVIEVDGYAEVDGKAIVVEIKATLRFNDAVNFVAVKLPKLRELKGNIELIPLIVYINEDEDTGEAIEYAKKNGVKVLKHYGEDEFEEA
uniref:hypothetical protein n=1 Tax=Caldivirga sp. UBA161 TaxID=1915569 RepID=UPI0025BB18F8